MIVRSQFPALALAGLIVTGFTFSSHADVSKTPPPLYATSIEPLLTPLEAISSAKDPFATKEEPGTIRLSETVTRVEEDGAYLRAVHSIIQPYSQKGAEGVGSRHFHFQSNLETVHVAQARTILPDGTSKALGPNAIFIQKGENSESVYDDGQDLVLVFPDVKPGVLCEATIVYEHSHPAVSGGYSEFLDWTTGWSVGRKRFVVDYPVAWKDRLKVESVGRKTGTPGDLEAPAGRLRRAWQQDTIARYLGEPEEAPQMQAGPGTWLTTFASWDEVAAWYDGLLIDRADLGETLKARIDEWTKDTKTPAAILDTLYDHAANDVRYEGLEFGISALQPYPCDTVWKNQYGDCKDKANLLVAMLRYKGIPAKVALVNTEHSGLVATNIPDFRHFNHAIAVVELPDEKGGSVRTFCDATIAHGRPGMLSPGSSDREILAIDGKKAQWIHTPGGGSGDSNYDFDLDMNSDGRISGWLTIRATGFKAIMLADSFAGADHDTAQRRLHDYAAGFFPGAEGVDVVLPSEKRQTDDTVVKVYFTCPPRQTNSDGRFSLSFPRVRRLFNDYGEGQERRTSYFQRIDRIRMNAIIRLPEGWQPEALPQPLKLETPPFVASAQWSHTGTACVASLDLDNRESVIPADKVAAPAQANRAMFSWLDTPLMLVKRTTTPVPDGQAGPHIEMPLMPTGKGQLALVDSWFPDKSDPAKRKAALEQVIRFFPNDPETVIEARGDLATQLFNAKKYQAGVEAFEELLKQKPDGIEAEQLAYFRYMQALCLKHTGREEEALVILRAQAADESLSDYRRGWSAAVAGEWLARRQPVPVEASSLLQQSFALNDECRESSLLDLIPVMAACGQGDELAKSLNEKGLFNGLEDGGQAVLDKVVAAAKTGPASVARAAALLPWLQKARDAVPKGPTTKALASACITLENWSGRTGTYTAIRHDLIELLERESPDDFRDTSVDAHATLTEAEAALTALDAKDSTGWLQLAAGVLRKFEPGEKFPHLVWRYLAHLQAREKQRSVPEDKSLFPAVAALTLKLPHDEDDYWECRFIQASWLKDHGHLDNAAAEYRAMPEDPQFISTFAQAASHRLGEIHEIQGRWKDAAECYLKFKDQRRAYVGVNEYILRAGLLLARSGEPDQALAAWSLLGDTPASIYEKSDIAAEIREAIVMAADPKATQEQWTGMGKWWAGTFVPYFATLHKGPLGRPKLLLHDEAAKVDLRCRKAVAEKNLDVVTADLAGVAASARWLPSHLISMYAMMETYVAPLSPSNRHAGSVCFAAAAGLVKVADPAIVGLCLRYDAAISFDSGQPDHTLQVMENQWIEAPGRSDEHRERCGWLFAAAANATGKQLEKALEASTYWIKRGPVFLTFAQWAPIHADLLVRTGKKADAISFLKELAARPALKDKAESQTVIAEKLAQLESQEDPSATLTEATAAFLKKHKPAWYDYVGPATLSDPRVGDATQVLTGDLSRFHRAELFRLHALIAASPDLDAHLRGKALTEAVMAAGMWQTTWDEAYGVWSEIFDNKAIPMADRLMMMWNSASLLASTGQVGTLAKLRQHPLFANYSDAYASRYFPMLEALAKGASDGPGAIRAAITALADRELDGVELSIIGMDHLMLLTLGDQDGAAVLREALKTWKLQPSVESERNARRLAWMRAANQAKGGLAFQQGMFALYRERFEALAAKAPAGWENRVDLQFYHDLGDDEKETIQGAKWLTGKRFDRSDPSEWFIHARGWLKPGGTPDPARGIKAIALLEAVPDDQATAMALEDTLALLGKSQDRGWADLDEAVKVFRNPARHPISNAVLEFWQLHRDYRVGQAIDSAKISNLARQAGIARGPITCALLEALFANGDVGALETALNAAVPEDLTERSALTTYIPLLQSLGRKEELELALEGAEKIIRREMMTAWMDRSARSFEHACDIALVCDRTDLLPAAWLAAVPDSLPDGDARAFARIRVAQMKKDWRTMKAGLDAFQPTNDIDRIDHDWLMVCALEGLGDHPQALVFANKVLDAPVAGNSHVIDATRFLRAKP